MHNNTADDRIKTTVTLDEMLAALRESQSVPTKLEAGQILANGGWAVFPLPDQAKFDNRLSYLQATIDAGIFTEMAETVMDRNECHDVNIALAPGKCVVPLLVIDLDGAPAIESFRQDAWSRGHADLGLWLRVNTTRPDAGRHAYFTAPPGRMFGNGSHRWGGEVRSGKGHVVMPPSTTPNGRYTWTGSLLSEAPEWVVEGLPQSAGGNYRKVDSTQLGNWLDAMSAAPWTSYARAAMDGLLDDLLRSHSERGGRGRNPTLARAINRVLDLALEYQLPAMDALNELRDAYLRLFDLEEQRTRDLSGEFIRCVKSWASNKKDLEKSLDELNGLQNWIASRVRK